MEKKMMGCSVLALALVVLIVSANQVHAITCNEAVSTLMPCKPYLVGDQAKPTVPCCSGVKAVKGKVSTTADRRTLCQCFKKTGPAMGVKIDRAQQLPGLCSVKLAIPVDPKVDCSKILA